MSQIVGGQIFQLGQARDLGKTNAQQLAGRKTLRVVHQPRAHGAHRLEFRAAMFQPALDGHGAMASHELKPRLCRC